jgi:predicted ATPase
MTATGNLPTRLSSFIGRETEQRELQALLQRPEVRLLTLTGPGGAGKTSLAIQVAGSLATSYPNGVWFVDLAPVSDPEHVAATILQALGIPERAHVTITALLQEWLRPKRLLLLLDNFEQVLDAAPLVSTILSAAPATQALVTSRAALQLRGEREYPVAALELPSLNDVRGVGVIGAAPWLHATPLQPDDLLKYATVALFVERGQAVVPSFALTQANAAAVAEICIRLDGLPLAIELAAARVRLFTPEALRDRLQGGGALTTLTGKTRDLPSRQQTIRATIAWSYDLLSPVDQALFARLGVFVGGWTIPAAGAVCADTGLDAVEGLATLVEHNLVRPIATGGEPRFTMLETLREYALERLAEVRLLEAVREQHAAYYLSLAEQMELARDTAHERIWLERLEPERGNIRAVNQWAIPQGKREFAQRFNGCLFAFWGYRSTTAETRHWLKAALAIPEREASTPSAQIAEALALSVEGHAAGKESDYADAEACFGRALMIYTALDNQPGMAAAYRGLGFTAMLLGDLDRAQHNTGQSLVITRAVGDRWGAAWSLFDLGLIALARGDLQQAQISIEKVLPELHALGILYGAFRAYLALGHALRAQGDLSGARKAYYEALCLQQQMHYTQPTDEGLDGLANIAATEGDPMRAARLFGAAQAIRVAVGWLAWSYLKDAYDRDMAQARSQLSDMSWQVAWDAGNAMSLDEAVAYALAE